MKRLAFLLLALAACLRPAAAEGRIVRTLLDLGGEPVAAVWYLPDGDAAALVTMQHGFARECANLRDTTWQLMERSLMALCLEAPMAGGNPVLAEALAERLATGMDAPEGRPLPAALIVAGHSAGALFASRVGWKLAQTAPDRLRGAVLLDPVADAGFTANLLAVSDAGRRPVLAIGANAAPCNAQHNAWPALRQVRQAALAAGRSGFVGLQLTDRSTHVDAEGDDTTALAVLACRQGPPRPANATALRTLAAQWAVDMATGRRSAEVYPGGVFVDTLLGDWQARLID